MFHRFQSSIEEISLPEQFTNPFCYTPHHLCVMAAEEVQEFIGKQSQWVEELAEGKMFGVLVVRAADGEIGYIAAYSGNIAHSNKHDFFVPPVYDLLDPAGFFVPEERRISNINEEIERVRRNEEYLNLQEQLVENKTLSERKIEEAKSKIRIAKKERDERRKSNPGQEELNEIIRNQFFPNE